MKNKPYVKQYDERGVLTNPINGEYLSLFKNRSQRRGKATRFIGNQKGHSLTTTNSTAYHRSIQYVLLRSGQTKQIEHYILKKK